MNILKRLATERQQDAQSRNAAFAAFWTVNAGTTALYGYSYLAPLFRPFADLLPIAEVTAATVSGILGAAAALAVLDCAYTAWNRIKLHDCETQEQYKWAHLAEQASFTLSLAFSAIVLLTVSFQHLLSAALFTALNNTSALAFVAITIFHLIAWQQWKANSIQTRETATKVKIDGQRNSEELAYREKLNRSAVLKAATIAEADEEAMSDAIGRAWGERMKQSVIEQYDIAPTTRPQLAAPNTPTTADSQLAQLLQRIDAGTTTSADASTINALLAKLQQETSAGAASADFLAQRPSVNGHSPADPGHRGR